MFAKISFFFLVSNNLEAWQTIDCFVFPLNSWDEWIGEDFVLKHTEENIEKQQELGMKQGVKSAMAWRVSKMKPRSPNGDFFFFFSFIIFLLLHLCCCIFVSYFEVNWYLVQHFFLSFCSCQRKKAEARFCRHSRVCVYIGGFIYFYLSDSQYQRFMISREFSLHIFFVLAEYRRRMLFPLKTF